MNVHETASEGGGEWTTEELARMAADERLRDRAERLFRLGLNLDRVAQVLDVAQEEVLRAVPRVHARVLLPSSAVYTLSPAQRLRWEDW